ncbi:MAG: hypothetical protein GC149_05850 [Gammaproteobacteria bacterium]|nr:hypothetical protein [Gammaproteobacteria bacterium]
MNTQQAVQQLFNQLDALTQQLGQLETLLQQEETALTQNNFDTLERLARDKETLSAQIEQVEKQRQQLCKQLNIPCDFAGIKTYLNGVSGKLLGRFEQQWDKVSTLGSECASQNQVNGILLAHRQRHTQQALAILRGATGGDELYSASGSQQQVMDTQHTLGRV